MAQYDVVTATFRPKDLDTLRPSLEKWIGWRGEFQAVWMIEEGPYEGDFAMMPVSGPPYYGGPLGFYWVPESDLQGTVHPQPRSKSWHVRPGP